MQFWNKKKKKNFQLARDSMEREKISFPLSPVHIAHLFEFHLSCGLNEPNIKLSSEKYMKKVFKPITIGYSQLAIHVVQNRRAGEQKSHWDKANKGNY